MAGIRTVAGTAPREGNQEVSTKETGLTFINFVRQGDAAITHQKQGGILITSDDWNLKVDLQQQLSFPSEIAATTEIRYSVVVKEDKYR